jgi:tetratricopeptide (TPR) repeat protein
VLAAEMAAHRESMEARLRQAELARAEARTRAEEERKRRRVKAALAAAGLALVLLATGGGLWLWQVQMERRAEAKRQEQALRQEVEGALTQAVRFRKGFHFREARELLEQAGQRLELAGPNDLRQRASQARDDLTLVERLDAARLQATTIVEGKKDVAGGMRMYAAAFAGVGFDRKGEDVTALAARVRDSAVREEIVAALDDWASLTPDRANRERLLAVARAADPDGWRDRLRQPQLWWDRDALTKLAEEAKDAELSPQLATALGRVLRQGGGDAVPLLSAAQTRFPQDFWINYELAAALYEARRWDEAASYYRAALALRPQASAGYNNFGVTLVAQGRLDEAIDRYKQALRVDRMYAPAHTNLGNALKDKGRLDEAISHQQQALRLDPKLAAAHTNLGLALAMKGQLEEAIHHYEQALRIDSENAVAHTNLGAVLADKGRTDEAIGHYEQALRIDPKHAPAHTNLGAVLADKGRTDEAIGHYEQALRIDPKSAAAHTNLGLALATKGRQEEAIRHYEQALRIDPKLAATQYNLGNPPHLQSANYRIVLAATHYNLGNALQVQGRLDEAIEHYEQALRIDPKYALAHYNFGIALAMKGQLEEAIRHYEQALRIDPKYAPAHTNLGIALAKMGQLEKAMRHFEQALQIDPTDGPTHANLGLALATKGEVEKAIRHFEEALRIDPKMAPAHYNLGNALQVQGRLDEAIEHYELAQRIDTKHAPAHTNLGAVLATKGRLDEAIDHFQHALRLDPKLALAHENLGKALLAQGRFHEAQAATRRSLELLPQDHPWRAAATQRLQRCEQLLALEGRLPAVLLEDKDKPADAAEYLGFAELCSLKKQYAAAARLSAVAFAAIPQLADEVKAGRRYNAACAAARAAAGQGADAAMLDAKERAHWRRQALDWLRADLATWSQQAASGTPEDRSTIMRTLTRWRNAPDLAGVRDPNEMGNLSEGEREAWRKFWAEAEALRKKVRENK